MTDQRPNPDQLLNKIQREEAKELRGQLKIFFGACAGVGKTYTMLVAAQAQRAQNQDVVIGIVETHGRPETMALLQGLETLPLLQRPYRGQSLQEFDLDAALKRKPTLIIVDELAHSNVKGSRHTKRWQDVEELLDDGINVYTTMNVQHLESLNDVVSHITGIRVYETLPDQVFNTADEVTMVDLPPDDLLQRLKAGKVYMPEQTQQAITNFFRKGNLIALRELALRRMADRVDVEMREYRADQAIQRVWQTKERILVCIGPKVDGEKLIRSAYRLASQLQADWLAVYVETPRLQKINKLKRTQVLKNLKLAQDLGAETATLSGSNLTATLLSYARSRNVSKIVVGKSHHPVLAKLWHTPLSEQLSNKTTDIDIYVVGAEQPQPVTEKPVAPNAEYVKSAKSWKGYVWAIAVCSVITFLSTAIIHYFTLSNIAMLYLLGVALIAIKFGRGPSVLAALINVLAFDFFFVPPQLSFSVSDTQYLITFGVMLVVGLLISNLTSNLRYEARVAVYREKRTHAVYILSKELATAMTTAQIAQMSIQHLNAVFNVKVELLLPDSHDKLHPTLHLANNGDPVVEVAIAQWVYDHQQNAGFGTQTLPASSALYLPLRTPMRTRGVLAITPTQPQQFLLPEQQRLLETCAAQIALALERVHYAEVARDALLTMESERLRNLLLSTISRDLRTPLQSILDVSRQLCSDKSLTLEGRQALAQVIYEKTLLMDNLATNLIDMARLQAGSVEFNKQWSSLAEIIANTLRAHHELLAHHQLQSTIPAELPGIFVDATLLERVFTNLLENASKYTPMGSLLEISAWQKDMTIWVAFDDNGPGLPPGMEERIFEKFTRGEQRPVLPGVGLGLAICRAIIEAHGGEIQAQNRPQGGARFVFWVPLGEGIQCVL